MDELRSVGLAEAFLPLTIAAEKEGLFDYTVLVAQDGDQVLGFVAYSDEELAWLYVDPAQARQGIGRRLALAAMADRPEGLAVEVLQGNEPALGLYRHLGFIETELVSGRMPGNEDFRVTVHCLRHAGGDVGDKLRSTFLR